MKTELNEHTRSILGSPGFLCHTLAEDLSYLGMNIPRKDKEEQATAIHFMLNLYETYGDAWRTKFKEFGEEMQATKSQADKRKTLEKFTGGKTELNEQTRWILGLVNYKCYQYANWIRTLGHPVSEEKVTHQQADVLHFMLNLYEKYGDNWWHEFQQRLMNLEETPF